MSHLFLCISFLCCFSLAIKAQKTWTGEGQNAAWDDPLNWSGHTLPGANDDVLLNHAVVPDDYRIILPAAAVVVKSIRIIPGAGDSIELILPASNVAVPALSITGPGYGLDIHNRGIFRNASGVGSGSPLTITDSIRVNNGGRFIHNTAGAHATMVERLATSPGTEFGIMEFDVPDASTTLSLSGRTYGTLVLSARAAGGSLNYTAAGTNKVIIRSDLRIEHGVAFNLNFSDTIFIRGDLLQEGGIFNLGNTARTVVISVSGDIVQAASALITETGSGHPKLMLAGTDDHQIDMRGMLSGDLCFTLNSQGDAILKSALVLPYRLELQQGRFITSSSALLTLASGCSLTADSLSSAGFVSGPLRRLGLNGEYFLFAVGKESVMRWLNLLNATGDYTVEYFCSAPNTLSGALGAGVHHISNTEYWNISAEGAASTNVSARLSFSHPHSGEITDPGELRVAQLIGNTWENTGNSGFGGNAGVNGWVTSFPLATISPGQHFFTLASASGDENPLPILKISLQALRIRDTVNIMWSISPDAEIERFEILCSSDNVHYSVLHIQPHISGTEGYSYKHFHIGRGQLYIRLRGVDNKGTYHESRTVMLKGSQHDSFTMSSSGIASSELNVVVDAGKRLDLALMVVGINGSIVQRFNKQLPEGVTQFHVNTAALTKGVYLLYATDGVRHTKALRFIRR